MLSFDIGWTTLDLSSLIISWLRLTVGSIEFSFVELSYEDSLTGQCEAQLNPAQLQLSSHFLCRWASPRAFPDNEEEASRVEIGWNFCRGFSLKVTVPQDFIVWFHNNYTCSRSLVGKKPEPWGS